MIISYQHNFISIKSGKTASSSIEKALATVAGPDDVLALSEDDPSGNRNTRLSLLQALVLWAPIQPNIDARKHRIWRREYYGHMPASRLRKVLGAEEWNRFRRMTVVRNPYERALSNFFWNTRNHAPSNDPCHDINRYVMRMPAWMLTNWQMYALDDEVLVDTFLRYETLEADFRRFVSTLGVEPPVLSNEKGGHRPKALHYRDVLDPESRRRIEKWAQRELAYFSYEW